MDPQAHADGPIPNPVAPLRLDEWVRGMATTQPLSKDVLPEAAAPAPQTLPEPVFPRHPELLGSGDGDPLVQQRHWTAAQLHRKARGWLYPYVKSRILRGDFHPILAYLFTDWKCNVDCHYCPSWDNRAAGMAEDVARRSIDWLASSTTCRVIGVMGGEPLMRARFVHRVVDYAVQKGFWIYLGTNGQLLTRDVVDRLADAGVAVFNVAVDAIDRKPGLPKALNTIRPTLEYLLRKQYRYGYMAFFNICICHHNHDDVKELTEYAHACGISTDYHICESPMYTQPHFKHLEGNETFITPDDWPQVDTLVDWIIEKQRAGYSMVNSIRRLEDMKAFMRGRVEPWNCRAGQNVVIIRTDGTLAPCFPLYSAGVNWGSIEHPRFDAGELNQMKSVCQHHCFSTLQHNVGFCYNDARVVRWVLKQAAGGFRRRAAAFE
jgi:MoaA/NifB/PqqE/SkfB family radical SAM enzyme